MKKKDQVEHLRQQASQFIEAAKKEAESKAFLNAKRKNPWQAPPLTHNETVFVKKERTIEEIG